jgi:hypothetical protein
MRSRHEWQCLRYSSSPINYSVYDIDVLTLISSFPKTLLIFSHEWQSSPNDSLAGKYASVKRNNLFHIVIYRNFFHLENSVIYWLLYNNNLFKRNSHLIWPLNILLRFTVIYMLHMFTIQLSILFFTLITVIHVNWKRCKSGNGSSLRCLNRCVVPIIAQI